MTWLLISQTALWIVLLALSVVTLALARQVAFCMRELRRLAH